LLPRSSFPAGITAWTSQQTAPNAGATASGLQLAHYRWGYVIVTPDVLPTLRAAQRRYTMESDLLHGDRRIHMRTIGQASVVWVTRDGVVGDTVTTILLRVGRIVAMINVGASRAALAPAARLARAVAAHACR
jgi:hypothetical protein